MLAGTCCVSSGPRLRTSSKCLFATGGSQRATCPQNNLRKVPHSRHNFSGVIGKSCMNTYKVLIAEDEGLIAMDIAAHLEALGHTVVGTVSTAAEAIEQAPNAQVVLMDIRLDGPVDGIEAASKIRERYRLPVVFLTAQADPSTLERAKLAAPYGYMIKPLVHASLQPSIEIAMYKHQMEARLEESEAWMRA